MNGSSSDDLRLQHCVTKMLLIMRLTTVFWRSSLHDELRRLAVAPSFLTAAAASLEGPSGEWWGFYPMPCDSEHWVKEQMFRPLRMVFLMHVCSLNMH